MTLSIVPNTAVRLVGSFSALDAFRQPDCAAAILQRAVPREVSEWLSNLPPDMSPRVRCVVPVDDVKSVLDRKCKEADLPSSATRDWLIADLAELAARVCDLMSTRHLRLRLDVVETDACRRFHVDAIHARLVCTYRGTGTQYGYAAEGTEPRDIHTVATGAPILLRGSLWPETPRSGLLHRSPPIEGTGETRLVLVLDPIDGPDAEEDWLQHRP